MAIYLFFIKVLFFAAALLETLEQRARAEAKVLVFQNSKWDHLGTTPSN